MTGLINRNVSMAWQIAALSRQKKLKKLDDYLVSTKAKISRREMEANLKEQLLGLKRK